MNPKPSESTGPNNAGWSRRALIAGWLAVAALLPTACNSPDAGVSLTSGSQGGLNGSGGAVGIATADFILLDLTTGGLGTAMTLADITTNAVYRSNQMVFKRIKGLGADFFIGVFEVTQKQWQNIAGATSLPWTGIDSSVVGGSAIADGMPAFALSHDLITSKLATFNATAKGKLQLPTDQQWAFACAGGSTGEWSWGNATDFTVLQTYAAVWETQGATIGPRQVGGRAANGFGLYDMHGNVWEWTSPGTAVRGGSWNDSYAQAKTANQATFSDAQITAATSHVLIGARLVLIP